MDNRLAKQNRLYFAIGSAERCLMNRYYFTRYWPIRRKKDRSVVCLENKTSVRL